MTRWETDPFLQQCAAHGSCHPTSSSIAELEALTDLVEGDDPRARAHAARFSSGAPRHRRVASVLLEVRQGRGGRHLVRFRARRSRDDRRRSHRAQAAATTSSRSPRSPCSNRRSRRRRRPRRWVVAEAFPPPLEPVVARRSPMVSTAFDRDRPAGRGRPAWRAGARARRDASRASSCRSPYQADLDAWRIVRSDGGDVLFAMPRCVMRFAASSSGDARHTVAASVASPNPALLRRPVRRSRRS